MLRTSLKSTTRIQLSLLLKQTALRRKCQIKTDKIWDIGSIRYSLVTSAWLIVNGTPLGNCWAQYNPSSTSLSGKNVWIIYADLLLPSTLTIILSRFQTSLVFFLNKSHLIYTFKLCFCSSCYFYRAFSCIYFIILRSIFILRRL